ncbi:MAG: trypsin-like peptidase domain-containing protein [Planctomycetota bacterium]|nr:trypsin-like peptidase domain-containing protein [Planctomycetota bacterium]
MRTFLVTVVALALVVPLAAADVESGVRAYEAGRACTFQVFTNAKWNKDTWSWDKDDYGSGIGYRRDGWVLTAAHVVADADSVTLVCPDGIARKAERWVWSERIDIAVVYIPDYEVPVPSFGSSAGLKKGQPVFAVGRPKGYARAITGGIVSDLHANLTFDGERKYPLQSYILTDAQANPGNSGGPLLDPVGRVVGMVVASLSVTESKTPAMSFALPIDVVRRYAERLRVEQRSMSSSTIEAELSNLQQVPLEVRKKHGIRALEGVVLYDVAGKAKAAGLRDGDVVLAVDGVAMVEWMQLRVELGLRKPGTTVELRIERGGKTQTLKAEVVPWKDD